MGRGTIVFRTMDERGSACLVALPLMAECLGWPHPLQGRSHTFLILLLQGCQHSSFQLLVPEVTFVGPSGRDGLGRAHVHSPYQGPLNSSTPSTPCSSTPLTLPLGDGDHASVHWGAFLISRLVARPEDRSWACSWEVDPWQQ